MKINNLFVGYIYDVLSVEDGVILITEGLPSEGPYILRKESEDLYVNLDNDKVYTTKDLFGLNKVDKSSLRPLTSYYGVLNTKKTQYKDSEDVHKKVKSLKRVKKIR